MKLAQHHLSGARRDQESADGGLSQSYWDWSDPVNLRARTPIKGAAQRPSTAKPLPTRHNPHAGGHPRRAGCRTWPPAWGGAGTAGPAAAGYARRERLRASRLKSAPLDSALHAVGTSTAKDLCPTATAPRRWNNVVHQKRAQDSGAPSSSCAASSGPDGVVDGRPAKRPPASSTRPM